MFLVIYNVAGPPDVSRGTRPALEILGGGAVKQPDSTIQDEAEKTNAIAMPEAGETETEKAERMEREREVEREEGIVPEDRGSPAAPSDRPENKPPHPQDVNEIGE